MLIKEIIQELCIAAFKFSYLDIFSTSIQIEVENLGGTHRGFSFSLFSTGGCRALGSSFAYSAWENHRKSTCFWKNMLQITYHFLSRVAF